MKKLTLSAVAVALSALFAGQALAADAPKAREQVRAELLEAQRTGDIIVNGELGLKENELYPHLYPKKAAVAGKTRAQVKAELAEAQRTGDVVVDGETGLKANELNQDLYPKKAPVAGKTRAQVKAELAEAIAKGELPRHEH